MPVLSERRPTESSENFSKTKISLSFSQANPKKNNRKKKKGPRLKFRKQFVSFASIIEIEKEVEDNLKKSLFEMSMKSNDSKYSAKPKQPQTEKLGSTKLPTLQKSVSLNNGGSTISSGPANTPRSMSGYRVPLTLPANLQPGAYERRKRLPLLSAIKPENERSERERFIRANFNYNPLFIYRFPAEPELLLKLGTPSDKYLKHAVLIMENAIQKYGSYEIFEEETGGKILQRPNIMAMIQRYLRREEMENEIAINLSEELLSRGSMTRVKGKPMLNVRIVNLREFWVEGLLRHEIGTHYLRSMNNRYHDWYNWKTRRDMNLKPINPTEEGLASLHSVLLRKDPSLWRAALLYYTAYQAAFLSLKELFRDLGRFVRDPYTRWDYCIRAKRGQGDTSQPGAFCKDQVYLEGALQLLKHRKTIDFHMLIRLGKIAWEDIGKLESIADLENTRIPFFMEDLKHYHSCLDKIAEANCLTAEVLEDV